MWDLIGRIILHWFWRESGIGCMVWRIQELQDRWGLIPRAGFLDQLAVL
jgi:hypothetical protein